MVSKDQGAIAKTPLFVVRVHIYVHATRFVVEREGLTNWEFVEAARRWRGLREHFRAITRRAGAARWWRAAWQQPEGMAAVLRQPCKAIAD
jgi:hypothetical protein